MSNHLAIATTTTALQRLLQSYLDVYFSGAVSVSAERPGSADSTFRSSDWRVNLFLYQVRPNASLRNEELAVRRADGSFANRPFFAVDLHYLLSFYGDETSLQPQRAMGVALAALHTWPVLDRAWLASTIASSTDLSGGDLDQQPVGVRITPAAMELEDLSRIWSVLLQTAYVPTVPYVVTALLLEPDVLVGRNLPVGSRATPLVAPSGRPRLHRVEKVLTTTDTTDSITASSRVRLHGSRLGADTVEVHLGEAVVVVDPDVVTDTTIELDLASVTDLRAGVQRVWVAHPVEGAAVGAESEAVMVAVRPVVTGTTVSGETTDGTTGLVSGTVEVTVDLTVGASQRVILFLNLAPGSTGAPATAGASAAPRDDDADPLVFTITDVLPGTWIVRLMVDGAESPLERAAPEPGEDVGLYASPNLLLDGVP